MLQLLILFGELFSLVLPGLQTWEKEKDEDGIQIFTRPVPESDFREFRGEMELEKGSIHSIVNVLLDVNGYGSLYPDCYGPVVLYRETPGTITYYLVSKAPWPFKDRDGIYELAVTENDSSARISIRVLPDYIPEKKQYVRLKKGEGFWEVRRSDTGGIGVIYQFLAGISEKVPELLLRRYNVDTPFQTLENLRKRL